MRYFYPIHDTRLHSIVIVFAVDHGRSDNDEAAERGLGEENGHQGCVRNSEGNTMASPI